MTALQANGAAITCLGGARTELRRLEVPCSGPEELLLRLRVVGFCGTDLFKLDTGAAAPGTVLGHEIVGEVLAPGNSGLRVGQRVAVPHHVPCGECTLCRHGNETMCATFRENLLSPGGFSEYVVVKPRAAALAARPVPDGVPDDHAVFMEPAACVLRGVERSGMLPGDAAVVVGAGSMGLLHLLVLRAALPECRVVVVDPIEARRALALDLGAAAAASPDEALDTVAANTAGLGADAIFDTVGGSRVLSSCLSLTREGGSVVLFAHAPSGDRADFDLNDLFKHERRILGTYSGALDEQRRVFDLIIAGRLDPSPLVSHRLPLDRFEEGVDLARRRAALKVLFYPVDAPLP